jgi:demethylmenaquinone methyltransferase/2-methoxy-6-polyprenyl-1,4-benzoquinol methylase
MERRRKSGVGESGEILRVFQSRRETRAFYDRISKFYDFLAERSERPLRAAGLQKLAPSPGDNVLEIGCGTGHCLVALAAAIAPEGRVLGLDLSAGMLKNSQRHLISKGRAGRVHLVCGDATRIPVRAEAFDAVLMSFTLELFDTPDIPQLLAECQRVLRPQGRIVVVGMSKEGQQTTLLPAFEWTHRHFPRILDCRPIFVRRALEAAGFVIEHASIRSMWIPVEVVKGVKRQVIV